MCPLSLSEIPLDRQAHASHDHGVSNSIAIQQPSSEAAALPALGEAPCVSEQEQPAALTPWWPSIQPRVQAFAAEVTGRAFVDSWAMPEVGDPGVFDDVARKAADAAVSVATDPAVQGCYRAAAVTDGRKVLEVVAEHHERAEARRERWLDRLGTVIATVVGLTVLAKLHEPKEV
jgi:hypothetical protein